MIAEKRKLFFFQQSAAMFNLTSRPGSAKQKKLLLLWCDRRSSGL